MSTNNDVFKVLVGNSVAADGDSISTFAGGLAGKIAVINADTNMTIDGSIPSRDIYFARIDETDVAISRSAGQFIPLKAVRDYTVRAYSAPQALIVKVGDYTVNCETEYGIRLAFSNNEIYKRQGYNQFTVPYLFTTGNCDECSTLCPTGDANALTLGLKEVINNDPRGLVVATSIARQALTKATIDTANGNTDFSGDIAIGGEVSDADLALLISYNATLSDTSGYLYTDLSLETVPVAVNKYCSVNLRYYSPRQTTIEVSGIAAFEGVVVPVELQAMAYEEGSGYDLKQLEYKSQSIGGSPYVLNQVTGTARNLEYTVDENEKYDVVAITYDPKSIAGWSEEVAHATTYVAFPTGNKVAIQAFLNIMDSLLEQFGFDRLADDLPASFTAVDGATVQPTEDATNVDTDGLA